MASDTDQSDGVKTTEPDNESGGGVAAGLYMTLVPAKGGVKIDDGGGWKAAGLGAPLCDRGAVTR